MVSAGALKHACVCMYVCMYIYIYMYDICTSRLPSSPRILHAAAGALPPGSKRPAAQAPESSGSYRLAGGLPKKRVVASSRGYGMGLVICWLGFALVPLFVGTGNSPDSAR